MAGGAAALAVADWAKADPLCASENKMALTIAADFSNQATLQFTSLASAAIPPPCVVILLRAQSKQWTEHNATGVFRRRKRCSLDTSGFRPQRGKESFVPIASLGNDLRRINRL